MLGQVPERPNGADCKSAVFRLQRFESSPAHSSFKFTGVPEKQAEVAQLVER